MFRSGLQKMRQIRGDQHPHTVSLQRNLSTAVGQANGTDIVDRAAGVLVSVTEELFGGLAKLVTGLL